MTFAPDTRAPAYALAAPAAPLEPDLAALRRALVADGALVHHTAASWTKLVVLLSLVAGLGALAAAAPLALGVALVPLVALPLASAVMIGHEAGHRSFARQAWHNELVVHLVFTVLGGLSGQHWKRKHNVLHHGHPNVVGVDDDVALWPMALTPAEHARSSRPRRWFQRHLQGIAFWPLTLFLVPAMRLASLRHLAGALRRGKVDARWALDVGCLAAHYALWIVVPGLVLGWEPAIVAYVALWSIVGVYLALVFTPAHLGLPLTEGRPRGFRHQLETTRNLVLPRWIGWAFIGLDHQIEHHLVPAIPHQNMALAGRRLEAWCAEHGLPYYSVDYRDAVRDVSRFVSEAWRAAEPAAVASREGV